MNAMSSIGSLSQIASMVPGLGSKIPKGQLEKQERQMKIWKYAMDSMTLEEKNNPNLIKAARIARIAKGAGRSEHEVRDLIAKYKKMKKMVKMMGPGLGRAGLGGGRDQMKQLKKMMKKGGLKGMGI